jgi:hypothetical protein
MSTKVITQRDNGTIPTVAVIVTKDNGVVDSFDAFIDDNQGNIKAEALFIEKMKEFGWDEEGDNDKPLDACLDDGYAEFGVDVVVSIVHS